MSSLIDFLKTGRLGVIACGMSSEEVRAALGEPEETSAPKYPLLYKYGALQLSFYKLPDGSNPFLYSITLYFHEPDMTLPEVLGLTGWLPSSGTTVQEVREFLDSEGIPITGGVLSGPSQRFVLSSSVRVTFDEGRLYSIGYTSTREPEYKQLTVKVRRKDLDLIHRWAIGRHISASDLCSEWIRDQVSQLEKMGTS
jgi:hypothetical protein